MLVNISEFRNGTRALGYRFNKRDAFFNIGGVDKTQLIKGDHNRIMVTTDNPTTDGKETLLRKSAHEIGRILESGADLADAPAQWLKFIQQNWPTYLVCITLLVICTLVLYFSIRRKLSSTSSSWGDLRTLHRMMPQENRKPRAAYSHTLEL